MSKSAVIVGTNVAMVVTEVAAAMTLTVAVAKHLRYRQRTISFV